MTGPLMVRYGKRSSIAVFDGSFVDFPRDLERLAEGMAELLDHLPDGLAFVFEGDRRVGEYRVLAVGEDVGRDIRERLDKAGIAGIGDGESVQRLPQSKGDQCPHDVVARGHAGVLLLALRCGGLLPSSEGDRR